MTAIAATLENPSLVFARSESKTVGFWGNLIERLRDNSPRVVGLLKIAMDSIMLASGNPFYMAYGATAIIGRLITITWGTKANQQKVAEKHNEESTRKNTWEKIAHPNEYPVETASAVSMLAESFIAMEGAITVAKNPLIPMFTKGSGYTPLIMGLIAVWSYANILFGKEKSTKEETSQNQESLRFASSTSKQVGWWGKLRQYMKENPVMVSSFTNIALCIAAILGGALEGHGTAFVAAYAMGIVANGVQALLVKKREFNLDGAIEDKEQKTHAEKIERERKYKDTGDNFSPALA